MKTLKFIEEIKNQSSDNIRTTLYKKGILCSYHPTDGRMILYTSKNIRFTSALKESNQALFDECNGLVIDAKNLKPLVIPPETFRSNINASEVNANLKLNLYDLYSVEDGTIFNLYYWEPCNSWRISTARSYDITDIKWGNLTYKEVVKELLKLNDMTEEQFYNSLDINTCYTFGFKHPSMHPFQAGNDHHIYKLWFIQSVTNGKVSYEYKNDFKIPSQTKFEFPEEVPHSTKYLLNELNCSLDNYLNDNSNVNYGYILRTKNKTETGIHSNILLESSLLQKIRQLYYHSNFNEVARNMNYNREVYTIVYSYLNVNTHTIFIQLFPEFRYQYDKLDIITSYLVKHVMSYLNNPNNSNKSHPLYDKVKFIYDSLNNQYKLVPGERKNIKLISTFILNNKFTDLYYSTLINLMYV